MNWYLGTLKKYAVFSGRARRTEYWVFIAFNFAIAFGLGLIEGMGGIAPESDKSILAVIYQLAVFIPSIAVGFRRMHDTGRSGGWIFVPIASVAFALCDGNEGRNRFGLDPKRSARSD